MLTFYGIKISADAVLSILGYGLFFWSEYLGGNKKIKSSSVLELAYNFFKSQRSEDEKLEKIVEAVKED